MILTSSVRYLVRSLASCLVLVAMSCIPTGCRRVDDDRIQGYIEGEFVYVSSPVGGTLAALHVERGTWVKTGDPLLTLDDDPQQAVCEEAAQRLEQARASLEDLKKGKRPSEIEAIEAQLQQAHAALTLAEK